MKNHTTLTLLGLLCYVISAAQYNQDFEQCDTTPLIQNCWQFQAFKVNGSDQIGATGCSAGSDTLNNPAYNVYFMQTPVFYVYPGCTVSFNHKVTNASSAPRLQVIAFNMGANTETVLYTAVYSNGATLFTSINWSLPTGYFRILFRPSGTGGSSRSIIDNFNITNATQATTGGNNCAIVLKTVIQDFRLSRKDGMVCAAWKAKQEEYTRYQLELSENGRDFKPMYLTRGTGSSESDYSCCFIAGSGQLYYRLKVTETDGSYYYTPIYTLPQTEQPLVFNNPCGNTLHIKNARREIKQLAVSASDGRLLKQLFAKGRTAMVDLESVAGGTVLLVRLFYQDGSAETIRVVK